MAQCIKRFENWRQRLGVLIIFVQLNAWFISASQQFIIKVAIDCQLFVFLDLAKLKKKIWLGSKTLFNKINSFFFLENLI